MKKRHYIPGPDDASRVCPRCNTARTLAGFAADRRICRVCNNDDRMERERAEIAAAKWLRELRREADEAFVDEWVRKFVMRDPACQQALLGVSAWRQ